MRILSLRALLILACAALVVTAVACQACASSLNVFPADMFSGSRAQQAQLESGSHHNFFSMAFNMIPASDESAKEQVNGLLGMKNKYDTSSMELPSISPSWMDSFLKPGVTVDNSYNPAMSSYDRLINRFENQSNIFAH